MTEKNFYSDNIAPIAPEFLAAIVAANTGTAPSYGADPYTERLASLARETFGTDLAIIPVATGTATNALALATLAPPFGGVYCAESAHINTDECGAPEFYSGGAKLLGLPAPDGKLRPEQLAGPIAIARGAGVHHVQPAALSIAQATEWGTVYTQAEVAALAQAAHANGLKLHMDGARLANAIARLGCSPAEITWKAGVDVLSLGLTKTGAMAAEAVVVFDPGLAAEVERRRKRAGHLWSKQRFVSAQLAAGLEGGLWLRLAGQANRAAARLSAGLAALPGVHLIQPVEANEIFCAFPPGLFAALTGAGFGFHDWPAPPGVAGEVVRLVASYATTDADVDALLHAAVRYAPRNE